MPAATVNDGIAPLGHLRVFGLSRCSPLASLSKLLKQSGCLSVARRDTAIREGCELALVVLGSWNNKRSSTPESRPTARALAGTGNGARRLGQDEKGWLAGLV